MVKHEPFNLCFRVRSPEILKDEPMTCRGESLKEGLGEKKLILPPCYATQQQRGGNVKKSQICLVPSRLSIPRLA